MKMNPLFSARGALTTGAMLLAVATLGADLPKVHIFATGGTISGAAPQRIMLSGYRSGSFTIEEITSRVPEIHDVAEVTMEQVVNVGSGSITDENLLDLSGRINQLFRERPEVDGVVVTHGTGTLEETAYFLNLTVRSDKPVVVVGSMRPLTAVSTDAELNLYNAVRIASSRSARGKGVLIALNDEIHAGREGTKGDTYRVETFTSREFGVLGYADPDKVVFYREPLRRHTYASEFDVEGMTDLPDVDILYGGYQEASPAPFQALVDAGVDGIILASGSRYYSDPQDEAVAKGIAVVRSDRKGQGRVLISERRIEEGIVSGDNLRPQKARILLKLALTKTSDPKELQRIFNTY